MLFTGDAGIETLRRLKEYLPQNITVLKVGHHGGPLVVDEKMLQHLNPKISLISTGVNYFGHPNKGTLDLLRNTEILRTDINHSVKISTDGFITKLFTYNHGKRKYLFYKNFQN